MKTHWMLPLLLMIALPARAEDTNAGEEEREEQIKFEIAADPSTYSLDKFRDKNVTVKALPAKKKPKVGIPTKEKREAAFAKVKGLSDAIRSFDDVERDKLYVWARTRKLPIVQKHFPTVPKPLLAKLVKQLQ